METIEFLVSGMTPLMTNNPAPMFENTGSGGRKPKIPSPEKAAEGATYRLEDGTCGIRAIAFRQSIVKASGQWRIGRYSSKGRMAHIMVEPLATDPPGEMLQILDPTNGQEPFTDYVIDTRRAVVQGNGVLRSRPRFDNWAARLVIIHDPELVEAAFIAEKVFPDAGSRIGVGDYRPERGGWFGRYTVKLIE